MDVDLKGKVAIVTDAGGFLVGGSYGGCIPGISRSKLHNRCDVACGRGLDLRLHERLVNTIF